MRRTIPDAAIELVEYREGGALSDFRQYLRVRRLREAFDVCAAPFSNGFFVSWWLSEVRPKLPTIASILIILGYLFVIWVFARLFGTFAGPILLILLVPLALWLASRMGNPEADDFILHSR